MINIDLTNTDFDIAKDKEHTTQYLTDLNNQTPFSVLDNTYTEHLRAVLNYSPILTVRKPFTGCEVVVTDPEDTPKTDEWVGTYLGITGYPYDGTLNVSGNQVLGKYEHREHLEIDRTHYYTHYVFSVPSTTNTAKTSVSYSIGAFDIDIDIAMLDTDIHKDGVKLTKEVLEQGITVTFLPPTLDTEKVVYDFTIGSNDSHFYGNKYIYTFPDTDYYASKFKLIKENMTVNGVFLADDTAIQNLTIPDTRVVNGYLVADRPVNINVILHNDYVINSIESPIYVSDTYGENTFPYTETFTLKLIPTTKVIYT